MLVQLSAEDEISRCIIFDRAFEQTIHTDKFLWRFEKTGEDGASHESAVLRRFAPLPEDVHRIGCKIAAEQNERKGQPPPGIGRRYYCGFRSAVFGELQLAGDGYSIEISHRPEGGEEAHLDVALTVTAQGKSAKATRRTDAGLALAEAFGDATHGRCECDIADNQHPFELWGTECLAVGIESQSAKSGLLLPFPARVLDR